MAITKVLADYVSNMHYDNIPKEAVNLAKMTLCDYLAVTVAGADFDGPRLVKEYVLERGGAAESSAPTCGFKTSAPLAALLSGTMGHILDYDDVAFTTKAHGAVMIAPVIWALGDKYNITGKRAIELFWLNLRAARSSADILWSWRRLWTHGIIQNKSAFYAQRLRPPR
jgi:2-methylcitrate dehydratase PrpD